MSVNTCVFCGIELREVDTAYLRGKTCCDDCLFANANDEDREILAMQLRDEDVFDTRCQLCHGSGEITCTNCDGSGIELLPNRQCSTCVGTGEASCPQCCGTGCC